MTSLGLLFSMGWMSLVGGWVDGQTALNPMCEISVHPCVLHSLVLQVWPEPWVMYVISFSGHTGPTIGIWYKTEDGLIQMSKSNFFLVFKLKLLTVSHWYKYLKCSFCTTSFIARHFNLILSCDTYWWEYALRFLFISSSDWYACWKWHS